MLTSKIKGLLKDTGIYSGHVEIAAVAGGGNNKIFSVQTGQKKYLVKVYYSHHSDTRNRLGSEFSFLSYAWKNGLRCIPEPIYSSSDNNMGIYEFIEGEMITVASLQKGHILDAAKFIRALNVRAIRDFTLPIASEGGFSIADHFAVLDNRIESLLNLPVESDIDHNAFQFVKELANSWTNLKKSLLKEIDEISVVLSPDDRCISPSDFGFHNALERQSGGTCFIDFEYAGWDDPAKMIGDFFSHPAVPVPKKYLDEFMSISLSFSENSDLLKQRVHKLLPLFRLKWCCIMLNEFLPDAASRRQFAKPTEELEFSKYQQLDKTQKLFNSIMV